MRCFSKIAGICMFSAFAVALIVPTTGCSTANGGNPLGSMFTTSNVELINTLVDNYVAQNPGKFNSAELDLIKTALQNIESGSFSLDQAPALVLNAALQYYLTKQDAGSSNRSVADAHQIAESIRIKTLK